MASTVKAHPSRRRVVQRRGTLDRAYDIALADLPPELRPAIITWIEARRTEYELRSALQTQMSRNNLRWGQVEKIGRELAYSRVTPQHVP